MAHVTPPPVDAAAGIHMMGESLREQPWFQIILIMAIVYVLFDIVKAFYVFLYHFSKLVFLTLILFGLVFYARPSCITTLLPDSFSAVVHSFYIRTTAAAYDMLPIDLVFAKLNVWFAWIQNELLRT